jgi:hypothetical protein
LPAASYDTVGWPFEVIGSTFEEVNECSATLTTSL